MSIPGVNASAAAASIAAARERLEKIARELGGSGRYTMRIFLPDAESAKLGWFNDGTSRQPSRPVLVLNAFAQDAAVEAVRVRFAAELTSRAPNVLAVLSVAAQAVRGVYVQRLASSGGDLTLRPLSPRTVARKRRLGRDPRIGRDTGAMAEAIARGQVVVSKA